MMVVDFLDQQCGIVTAQAPLSQCYGWAARACGVPGIAI
jgi:hypothetical protein